MVSNQVNEGMIHEPVMHDSFYLDWFHVLCMICLQAGAADGLDIPDRAG